MVDEGVLTKEGIAGIREGGAMCVVEDGSVLTMLCDGYDALRASLAASRAEVERLTRERDEIEREWEILATEHTDAEFDRMKRHEAERDSAALRGVLAKIRVLKEKFDDSDLRVDELDAIIEIDEVAEAALAAGPVDDPAKEAMEVLREVLDEQVSAVHEEGDSDGEIVPVIDAIRSDLRARAKAVIGRRKP